MSKPTPKPTNTTLILSVSDRGGPGKTTSLVLIADYLAATGRTFSPVECDLGNCESPAGFSHWFTSPVNRLDLRSIDDCDALLEQAAQSGLEFVLADLPANSSTDLLDWLEQSTSPAILKKMGLRLMAVCPVDESSGAPEGVTVWMAALGEKAEYLVMLNRRSYDRKSKARPTVDTTFQAWKRYVEQGLIARPFKTVEIPHLHETTMANLVSLRELPHKAERNPALSILAQQRVHDWATAVHAQLAHTGLFGPAPSASNQPAAA